MALSSNEPLSLSAVRDGQGNPGRTITEASMLYTIAVVLVILWLIGLVSSYTIGGFIHILLVVAIILVLLRVINGQKPL